MFSDGNEIWPVGQGLSRDSQDSPPESAPAGGLRQAGPVRANHIAKELGARLPGAPLGGEVDVHQAEALGVALAPLEVVEQGPREVAAQIHAAANRLVGREQV